MADVLVDPEVIAIAAREGFNDLVTSPQSYLNLLDRILST